jgi:hypothetical protein
MLEKQPTLGDGPKKLEPFSGLHDYKNILSSITIMFMDYEDSESFMAALRENPLPSLEDYVEGLHITQVDLKQSIDKDITTHPERVKMIDETITKLNSSSSREEAQKYYNELKNLL